MYNEHVSSSKYNEADVKHDESPVKHLLCISCMSQTTICIHHVPFSDINCNFITSVNYVALCSSHFCFQFLYNKKCNNYFYHRLKFQVCYATVT